MSCRSKWKGPREEEPRSKKWTIGFPVTTAADYEDLTVLLARSIAMVELGKVPIVPFSAGGEDDNA